MERAAAVSMADTRGSRDCAWTEGVVGGREWRERVAVKEICA